MKPYKMVHLRLLVSGAVAGSLLLACENLSGPAVEVAGVLAYSEAGTIHTLDLSNQVDNVLYRAEPGTDIRNLTWAPDGASLVFHTYEFGQHTQFIQEWKMYRISAGGTDLTHMFDRGGPETYPAYGPDGKLAYWSNDGLYIDGWLTYTSGWGEDQSAPSWSPDGRYLAFAWGVDLVRLSLEDTSETQMILEKSDTRSTIRDPAYSPNGNQIAFVREFTTRLSEIWLVGIDGSGERALTEDHVDLHPVWSRDGKAIVFVRNGNSIYTIGTDPGGRVQILLSHAVEHIAWTW